jgi:SAM-dependent methyltransferase
MHQDVLDLRNFYYRTQLGRVAQRAVRDRLVELWDHTQGQTVAGFGFAVPLLRPYLETSRRVIALMPGPQGVMPWPAGQDNISVLCEEVSWPIDTGSVDRLVVMHGLETSDAPADLLDECWRVLGPGGRAIFVVPNRAGLWSRRERTPFGYGRPYTMGQLDAQLRQHNFTPERSRAALYAPPSEARFWLRTAPLWESLGSRITTALAGGVLLLEVSKQVHAPRRGLRAVVKRPLRALDVLPAPAAEPV